MDQPPKAMNLQFLDGVKITGAGPVYDLIKHGAATICL